ncbi:AAA family ATPase [Psychrobacter frigidicola]|uniref:AAA family ATPase n=1 Tax=Psychrobacter frigidicola TaxID=45611 RepID=UPI0019195FC3|nr:AAA family ATPase [Psychrobacter frigidicola]
MFINVVNGPWDIPSNSVSNIVLVKDNWNDHGFYTTFFLIVFDEQGEKHDMGLVQIAFKGQEETQHTYSNIDKKFTDLNENYFSVGGGTDYYNEFSKLTEDLRNSVLVSLRDIVYNVDIIQEIMEEIVFEKSLLRGVSLTTIKNQYKRVLKGEAPLTEFKFKFVRKNRTGFSDITLDFKVYPESKPKTNIHVLIGRNGIGKTTILNGMIDSIVGNNIENQNFMTESFFGKDIKIDNEYFSRVVSVSFSAFDPFKPYSQQDDPTKGTCYSYIGLKSSVKEGLKEISDLHEEFIEALMICVHKKEELWLNAIQTLESDTNFSEMDLKNLSSLKGKEDVLRKEGLERVSSMSSGHAIVLITLTRLVATVEEKTLVLIDEPESHLHPPLLSAFVRALSNLLTSRNGVAIIATHSPVVLQEVPKSCAWKISRYGSISTTIRPKIETFGENVGVLTRDVFGLEVENSGFYHLLKNSVEAGKSFNEIMGDYNQQLGVEGRLILANLVASAEKRKTDAKDN